MIVIPLAIGVVAGAVYIGSTLYRKQHTSPPKDINRLEQLISEEYVLFKPAVNETISFKSEDHGRQYEIMAWKPGTNQDIHADVFITKGATMIQINDGGHLPTLQGISTTAQITIYEITIYDKRPIATRVARVPYAEISPDQQAKIMQEYNLFLTSTIADKLRNELDSIKSINHAEQKAQRDKAQEQATENKLRIKFKESMDKF